uniref:Carn_acyltransf domain-containing protein n=1 Tax=Caenorhabditis japonica TaxID=281687 RepID=H2W9P4_CAEJA
MKQGPTAALGSHVAIRQTSDLPKLPAPQAGKTLKHFLDFAEALQSKKEFEETKKIVNEFVVKDLPKLQDLLQKRAEALPNWLTPWWLNIAYLAARTPLPVVTSPGVVFPKFDFSTQEGQLEYAAKISQSAVKFYLLAKNDQLKPDMAGKSPLDMAQYKFLFGTTRVPKIGVDEIKYGCDYKEPLQHIVVIRNGHLFRVQVLDNNEQPLSISAITQQLQKVVSESETPNPHPVGIVSSDLRDKWANVYTTLKKDINNLQSIETVEKALFVVCLDKASEPPVGYTEKDEQSRQALHGGGSKSNSLNRWFDKTIQFVIGTNGYTGMTYEHTPAEGPPVGALMDYICDQITGNAFVVDGPSASTNVSRLDISTNEEINKKIEKSAKTMDNVAADLDIVAHTFKPYGKNFPKSAKISPDSFIQMAFLLAFYRIHSSLPPTYETATLRKFTEGRTENIRSPNTAAATFVKKMVSRPPTPVSEIYEALVHATNNHKKYTVDCMNAAGMDRHLLAWKLIAVENNLPTPEIFGSNIYQQLNHFQVSSSQVPTRNFIQMCFGPSALDCYGICYNPQETELHFMISTFKSYGSTSSKKFAKELNKALIDMKSVIHKATKENSKL